MNKLLATSIFVMSLLIANMAQALSADTLGKGVDVDAEQALQQTRSLIFASLEQNMRAGLCASTTPRAAKFGIDGIDSYLQETGVTSVLISVVG